MTFSPPWIWLIARTILRTQGNTFTSLLRDLPKDTDEQPDEEAHRVESRRMKSQEQVLLSPWSWGVSPSWYVNVLTHPEAL